TIVDKSKSVKSVLMQLFQSAGNTSIEGIDTTNACYGGTNALFNSINWVESSYWDGRYALVVAADIAVYKSGAARPTGGAGAIAMLVGPDAPIVFDQGLRATHMEHVWDFYKPDLHSEYPEVDGPLSNMCYLKALDTCYNRYLDKLVHKNSSKMSTTPPATPSTPTSSFSTTTSPNLDTAADYFVFHSPYTKLVQKSFARLAYNDFLRNTSPTSSNPDFEKFKSVKLDQSYTNRDLEKAFMELTKQSFQNKVGPSLTCAKMCGNMYCGSLYAGLVSLLANVTSEEL
ncbi:hypothetical protein HK102_011072, partial [Quaeritorhiza haematococci]